TGYTYSILILIAAVVIWQLVFLREFALWSERYKFVEEPRGAHRDPLMRFYSWVNRYSLAKLFLLKPGRGVTNLTSSLTRFRRGVKYSILILLAIFLVLELSALVNGARAGFPSGLSLSLISSDEG